MRQKKLIQKIAVNPFQFEYFLKKIHKPLILIGGLIVVTLSGYVNFLPDELIQGTHVRMLFLHVPLAFLSLGLYQILGVLSFIWLIWKIKFCLNFIKIIQPICLYLTAGSLLTGSLWGHATWGTYWIWDARLTSNLVLFMILIIQQIILRNEALSLYKREHILSWLILLGWLDLPIIHYSVEWWTTLHQAQSLSFYKPASIDSVYFYPLMLQIVGLMIWLVGLIATLYIHQYPSLKRGSYDS